MTFPKDHSSEIDLRKLVGYCLNPRHEEGRHKARVFASALGVGPEDADWLRKEILMAVASAEATVETVSPYGMRYVIDVQIRRQGKVARVRTAWMVRAGETIARLTTCYVL
jgi:hypothetical protein